MSTFMYGDTLAFMTMLEILFVSTRLICRCRLIRILADRIYYLFILLCEFCFICLLRFYCVSWVLNLL